MRQHEVFPAQAGRSRMNLRVIPVFRFLYRHFSSRHAEQTHQGALLLKQEFNWSTLIVRPSFKPSATAI